MTRDEALPGRDPRAEYMRKHHNKSDFTGKRWQDLGLLVVEYYGRSPWVDVAATAARLRGDRRRRRRQSRAG